LASSPHKSKLTQPFKIKYSPKIIHKTNQISLLIINDRGPLAIEEPTPKIVLIFLAQTDVYKEAADPEHNASPHITT
jgi:hypothetical protein